MQPDVRFPYEDNAARSDAIAGWMSVPGTPDVYAFPTHARVVTLAAQQTRAFNLVWALSHAQRLKRDSAVLVVGGGVAGITAAAAACALGANVTLAERVQSILHLQRSNRLRYVHPNVLEWPRELSSNPDTSLPFLNWTAGFADEVIRQLSAQWDKLQMVRPVEVLLSTEVVRLESDGMRYRAWFRNVDVKQEVKCERLYDLVILAVGFGFELRLPDPRKDSYWHNDGLDSCHYNAQALVSGCGDGGLTDALRLCIDNFNHATFVEMMQKHASELRAPLQAAEARVFRKLEDGAIDDACIGEEFEREYDIVTNALPESARSSLESIIVTQAREDTVVTLNDKQLSPFSEFASSLNRYALFLLKKFGKVSFRSGKITWTRVDSDYKVNFGIAGGDDPSFQILVVRHGPDRNVLSPFISQSALPELAERWSAAQDPTLNPAWPTGFFGADHSISSVDRYRPPHLETQRAFWFSASHDQLLAAVARVLILSGARILDARRLKVGPDSLVYGPDLGIFRDGKMYLIDVYSFQRPMTARQVRDFISVFGSVSDRYAAGLQRDSPQIGKDEKRALETAPQPLLISLRGFTAQALRLAHDHGILLWTVAELEYVAEAGGDALNSLLAGSKPPDE